MFIAYNWLRIQKGEHEMTIKEVEQILNIPRATIRYYEKEKLIDPHRIENGIA